MPINTDFTKVDKILLSDMRATATFKLNTKKFGDIYGRIERRLHEHNNIPCQTKITDYFAKIKEDK